MGQYDTSLSVEAIWAGKLRRYNNLSIWRQLIRPDIVFPNLRDSVRIGLGFVQSCVKLVTWRPDVIFLKGGFVCLPVGVAARLLRIPFVIHDSDAHPGLTNRILAKWATAIATGAPLKHYNYPANRARYVGIPVSDDCRRHSLSEQIDFKRLLGFDETRPLVVVTGGGLGAKRINDAVVRALGDLLRFTNVLLVSGSAQYDELASLVPHDQPTKFQLQAFLTPLTSAFAAADVVLARAGATTLLELSAMAKPTVLVPNGYLTGGHQLKNAAVYAEKNAAIIIDEHELDNNPSLLVQVLKPLVHDRNELDRLSRTIYEYARPNAAQDTAEMILTAVKDKH